MAVLSYAKGNVGDAAAYKSAILRVHPYPEVAAGLAELRQPLPAIDLEALRALPEGTLGREYAVHMDRERLRPLDLSENARHRLSDRVLGLRYTLLHDLFHVLLGFDTSLPGELGVWEFVGADLGLVRENGDEPTK